MFLYVQEWGGSDYSTSLVVDEKDHPYTGTNYAWVRARALGGKTNLGPAGTAPLGLRLQGQVARRVRRGLAIGYSDISPYYDKVDLLLGISGVKENLPQMPDGQYPGARTSTTPSGVQVPPGTPEDGPRRNTLCAGVTTDGLVHLFFCSKCYGRGACSRHVGGCDIHAAFDSPDRSDLPRAGHGPSDDPDQRHGA